METKIVTIVDRCNEHYVFDSEKNIQLVYYIGGKRVYFKIENCPHCKTGEMRYGGRFLPSGHKLPKWSKGYERCLDCGYYLFL